jgi:hypothetical protein
MSNDVFANNREVACKAAEGKSICAFPDVCQTPPTPPAGFLPIPYPNTAMASDTSDGSKTVQISGAEVMLKDKSCFKKSSGNEAATRSTPMGLITATITGKAYFNSWSMDVKIEGENAVRMADLTTHNHASFPGNSPAWPYLDDTKMFPIECLEDGLRALIACQDFKDQDEYCKSLEPLPYPKVTPTGKPKQLLASPESRQLSRHTAANECASAKRCFLQPYIPSGCCSPQTGHHIVEASSLFDRGRGGTKDGVTSVPLGGVNTGSVKYDEDDAPCVCAEGTSQHMDGSHGWMHTMQSIENEKKPKGMLMVGNGPTAKQQEFPHVTTFGEAKKTGIKAMEKVFPGTKCNPACLEKQLDNYHSQCGVNDSTPVKAVVEGNIKPGAGEGIARAESGIQECASVANEPMELSGTMAGLFEFPVFPFG